GSFDRVALRRAMEVFLPGAPEDLLTSIGTVGELFDWAQRWDAARAAAPAQCADRAALASDRVALRPVESRDLEPLYQGAIDPRSSYKLRFRGGIPSPQSFQESFHVGILGGQWLGWCVQLRRRCDLHSLRSSEP